MKAKVEILLVQPAFYEMYNVHHLWPNLQKEAKNIFGKKGFECNCCKTISLEKFHGFF